jgi:hypothetical protein
MFSITKQSCKRIAIYQFGRCDIIDVSTASRRETSDLWNHIPPFSSIKVNVSPIKHTDDGSNDDVFWQIFDELQNQSPDKKTVNGYKLKARLVSTNKFFVGDAVLN